MSIIIFMPVTLIYFVYHASINQGAFDLILTTLQKWFSGAELRLTSNKTEYMFISRKNGLNSDIELPTDANFSNNVTLLGFNLDSRLSYTKQVSSVSRRCYYFLRKIYSIRDTVDRKSLIELVRVMILLRLDYCNSLYYGIPLYIIQKLQRIMNSASSLIFRLSPGSPTSNYITELHWLPMKQRILYKILFFGHRLVHHPWKIPMYLGALAFQNDKVTRCQYAYNLKVPNVTTAFGRRSFSFAVPFEWNKRPFEMRLISHEFVYRKKLKTLFNSCFESTFEFANGT